MSLLRITTGHTDEDLIYTLLVDKALTNVSFIFAEDLRRLPEQDKLTVIPGFIGSYPNFFFSVSSDDITDFADDFLSIRSAADRERFYVTYGIRRSDTRFWQYSDWFNAKHKQENGVNAGLFDLNRYDNL